MKSSRFTFMANACAASRGHRERLYVLNEIPSNQIKLNPCGIMMFTLAKREMSMMRAVRPASLIAHYARFVTIIQHRAPWLSITKEKNLEKTKRGAGLQTWVKVTQWQWFLKILKGKFLWFLLRKRKIMTRKNGIDYRFTPAGSTVKLRDKKYS